MFLASRPAASAVCATAVRLVNGAHVGAAVASFSSQPAPPPPVDIEKIKVGMAKEKTQSRRGAMPWQAELEPDVGHIMPNNPADIGYLDGIPEETRRRGVIICQPTKSSMQSGTGKSRAWTVQWKKSDRWLNPLMGWNASADPVGNQILKFDTAEQAIKFCMKRGWAYELQPPIVKSIERQFGKKKYQYNFLPENVETELARNKVKTKHFAWPTANSSHYFRPLKFHGDGTVSQHGPSA